MNNAFTVYPGVVRFSSARLGAARRGAARRGLVGLGEAWHGKANFFTKGGV